MPSNIDLTKIITAEAKVATALADWRASRVVTKTEFAVALANAGIITEAEAEAWIEGVLPGIVAGAIATLPAGEQFAAKMQIKGTQTVRRSAPLLALLAVAASVDDAALDALF